MHVQREQGLWDVYSRKINKELFFSLMDFVSKCFLGKARGQALVIWKQGNQGDDPGGFVSEDYMFWTD